MGAYRIPMQHEENPYERGLMLGAEGQIAAARDWMREAFRHVPDDLDIQAGLRMAEDAAEGKIGVRTLQRLCLAAEAVEQARFDEALSEVCLALSREPSYSPAYEALGAIYFAWGRVRQAEEKLRKAITLDRFSARAHCTLAVLLHTRRRFTEAQQEYEHALALDPAHSLAHHYLGFCHWRMGRTELMIRHWQQAITHGARLKSLFLRALADEEGGRMYSARYHAGEGYPFSESGRYGWRITCPVDGLRRTVSAEPAASALRLPPCPVCDNTLVAEIDGNYLNVKTVPQ